MNGLGWSLAAAAAYLLGSIPFGVLIGRMHGVDVRTQGSRNIGATNVGRVLGRRWGCLCFALDAAKGAAPVLASGMIAGTIGLTAQELGAERAAWWLLVAAAALVGHMASPFLGFRGGKGVATGFGALLCYWPLLGIPALSAFAVWTVVVLSTRIVSLGSIAAAVALPIGAVIVAGVSKPSAPILAAAVLLSALVIVRHRSNIGRLLRGEEPRVGRPAPKPPIGQNEGDVRA